MLFSEMEVQKRGHARMRPPLLLPPGFDKDAKIDNVTADGDKKLHLTVSGGGTTFPSVLYAPKGEGKPDRLLGSVQCRGRQFLHLVRSDLKELDTKKTQTEVSTYRDFVTASRKADAKEKQAALKELLGKKDLAPQVAQLAGLELLGAMAENVDDFC